MPSLRFMRLSASRISTSDELGQTVMEYALVVALISVVALAALTGIGADLLIAASSRLTALVS